MPPRPPSHSRGGTTGADAWHFEALVSREEFAGCRPFRALCAPWHPGRRFRHRPSAQRAGIEDAFDLLGLFPGRRPAFRTESTSGQMRNMWRALPPPEP